MKQLTMLILALALALSLAACGANTAPEGSTAPTDAQILPDPGSAPEVTVPDPTDAPAMQIPAMAETVITDNEFCTFTVTGIRNNEHLGMQLQVFCENKTDRPVMFSWNNVSVSGMMYDPFWAEEVAAGKKVNSTIDLDTFRLEQMGVTAVDEVCFQLSVFDSEEWMNEPYVDQMYAIYPTGLSADTVTYPVHPQKNGETVIVDNDDVTFIIENVSDEISDYYTLHCYLANKTDDNLIYSWDSVSVNGFMADPYWAMVVSAGKQAYADISFLRSDLEAQQIDTVQQIEFTLSVTDYDDYDEDPVLEETYVYMVS